MNNFLYTKLDWFLIKYRFIKWMHNNTIYKFFYIYVGSIFMTIYMLFKYKFDFDIVYTQSIMRKNDSKYELEKTIQQGIILDKQLEELRKT
jgi:hypothetical protein